MQNDYIDNRLQKGAKKSQIRMNSASKVWFGKKVRNQMIYHNVTTYLLLWDDIKYVKCVLIACSSSTIFFHKLLYIYQVIELEIFLWFSIYNNNIVIDSIRFLMWPEHCNSTIVSNLPIDAGFWIKLWRHQNTYKNRILLHFVSCGMEFSRNL